MKKPLTILILLLIIMLPKLKAEIVYQENFDDGSADGQAGPPAVCWGGDIYIPGATNTPICLGYGYSRTMRLNYTYQEPVLGIDLRGYTNATLSYRYYQFDYAYCVTELKTVQSGSLDCNQSYGFTIVQYHYITQDCVTVNITLTPNAINYIRWRKTGGYNTAIWIDDIVIEATGGPSPNCDPWYYSDFGNFFQSGSVCDIFPTDWENCQGNGPYITSMPPCGGVGDYCMVLGEGYPYSSAETACFDLSSATTASFTYYYSWDGFESLSPVVDISTDNGNTWYTIVPYHQNTNGQCQFKCIDLTNFVGQNYLKLRFRSRYSGSSYHAYFDDMELHINQQCPSPTPTSTPTLTPTPTPTPTEIPSPTPTQINTPTQTPEPTLTPTSTPMPTSTFTLTPSPTNTPQPTSTPLPPTDTPQPTSTTLPTITPTHITTNTPSPTFNITQTPTYTPTPTPRPTRPPRTPRPTWTPFPTQPPRQLFYIIHKLLGGIL